MVVFEPKTWVLGVLLAPFLLFLCTGVYRGYSAPVLPFYLECIAGWSLVFLVGVSQHWKKLPLRSFPHTQLDTGHEILDLKPVQ